MKNENQLTGLTGENRIIFDQSPCGYHALDAEGFFSDVNQTLLGWLGYQSEELIGKLKFRDIIHKSDLAFADEKFPFRTATFRESDFDLILIKKDGSPISVRIRPLLIQDEADHVQRILYCSLDQSERKQAEERTNNLSQELEAFTYSVSHDLRAPLRSIDGYSRILQEDYAEKLDEEGRRVLNVIMSNAKRMGKLIDDLLDFSGLGRKEVQHSKIHMTSMVKGIAAELCAQEPERKIEIDIAKLHPAYADVDMMRQVWINLIENAIKYTGKKPVAHIEISSFEDDSGQVSYRVKDNGVGFDMKYAAKLFGVFQRLHKMQDFSGTGVGLAIVKRIISRHEGRVWAQGSLHDGATFYFSIPNIHGNT